MLHINTEDKNSSLLSNKTHLTLMFPGKSMEQLEQVIRVNEQGAISPLSSPSTPLSNNKKRLPSNDSGVSDEEKSIKKHKEASSPAVRSPDQHVPDIDTDDFISCLLLCAVLDPTSPKIRRRREFWRQNRPVNNLKLDSKYLSIGMNPSLSQASNSLVSNALAANAFSTGSLASNALTLKKSLERISENVSMSMNNRNALSLPQSFRNAAVNAKGCKNYPQAIGGLRLSAVTDLSSINPNYHGLNHQYLTAPWQTGPNVSASSSFYGGALSSVASEMSGLSALPYSSSALLFSNGKHRSDNQFTGIRGRPKPGSAIPFYGGNNGALSPGVSQSGALKPAPDMALHPALTGQYGSLPNTQY